MEIAGFFANLDFGAIANRIPWILEGLRFTISLSLIAAVLGSIIGLVSVLLNRKKNIVSMLVNAYIDVFRGTPVYFQLAFFHFGLPQVTGIVLQPFTTAVIVFALNSGAYLAEIIRSGVEQVNLGQIEAAKALGVSNKDIMKDIIIPQAVRNVLPALVNEFITLTKETSVVSSIGIADMMRRFNIVSGSTYLFFEPLLVVGIAYYCLNKLLSFGGKALEAKLKYD
ncbi:MAG: amino acid ABC transporter permease [Erysipelotrichaceae bacterium]